MLRWERSDVSVMRSIKLLAVGVLAVILALSSAPGASATIISAFLDPECGPPGTYGTLHIRFTGSFPTVQTDPDLGSLPSDSGDGVVGYFFTVPDGVRQITFTIFQDDVPIQTVTFCPSPVGGVVLPANTLAVLAPWLAVIGLAGCIGTAVVIAKKRLT
jgi:hypothetical protein